jgi:hypothetical protein
MARRAPPSLIGPAPDPAVLKACLQLLVCLSLAVRLIALASHLRRAWQGSPPPQARGRAPAAGAALAGAFRDELRRRGLLADLPLRRPD